MRKEWKKLSPSQSLFIDYVYENLNQSNRIIPYKQEGHFGMEYALLSRFKRAEILNLKQLKTKTGKNFPFRILHITAAIVAFILNESKVVDMRATIATILSNMENVYLGIDKSKEYLKYLHIKKLPHKNAKIHFIIRISENDIETDEDIQCFCLLCKLIETKRINKTILLVMGENLNLFNTGIQKDKRNIPLFKLSEDDLDVIAKQNNLSLTENISKNIDLIQKLGLQFFIDNFNFFDTLAKVQSEQYDWIRKMDWIIGQISKKHNVASKKLYSLLEFSSFFEKQFSKLEIQNFDDNRLEAENLDIACKLAFICQENSSFFAVPTYFFKLEAFKAYFGIKYVTDLDPLPSIIYHYFRENHPFNYMPPLKVLKVDSSFVDNIEKQSLIIIGYYYQNIEKGVCNYKDFLEITTKDSVSANVIRLFEYFKHKQSENNVLVAMQNVIQRLKSNVLNNISTCACYVMILQLLKENYIQFDSINFSEIMNDFCSIILKIDNKDNYNKYWQVHFKCQYSALSLEDEKVKDRSARRFLDDVKKIRDEENFCAYIHDNNLRGFTRIDLLSYSLGYDNAREILEELYNASEESTILKELARINYSAYLIENELYNDAEKILKKGDVLFLENINIDTYCGYLNNLYLAQLGNESISGQEYISYMEKLICKNISFNDKLIVQNNLAVSYLKNGTYVGKGINALKENFEKGNYYNRFLAVHNLLSYYFIINDKDSFNFFYDKIYIPKIFLSDKTFFLNKFKWMKENIGQTTYENFKHSSHVTPCYNQLYLVSSIERWFE